MRVCGIVLDVGRHKRLLIGSPPRGNWASRLEFRFLRESIELGLDHRDVLDRFLLGIPSCSLKVARYRTPFMFDKGAVLRHDGGHLSPSSRGNAVIKVVPNRRFCDSIYLVYGAVSLLV
jgi:hypothetical protein